MRTMSLLILLLAGVLAAAPAQAGKVSYVDGRGQWVPTGCMEPKAPEALPKNPETAANDMNARVAEHNAYVAAAEAYMACVSQEAGHDAEAFSQLITTSAQDIINGVQGKVKTSAALVHAKPAVQ